MKKTIPFIKFVKTACLMICLALLLGRAAILGDPTVAPLDGPVCEVIAIAKRDLKAGQCLDGIGGFCAYGLIDNAASARALTALPIGLSQGCVLRRDIPKDAVLSFDDVVSPPGRLAEALWREQNARWPLVLPPQPLSYAAVAQD